jgi:RNA polymerase sigma factor (sigma-70 family)
MSHEEAAKRLQVAINSLPEDYRRVIILYKIEERSLPEVAAEMGRSKVATCRLVARALSKLRKKLET